MERDKPMNYDDWELQGPPEADEEHLTDITWMREEHRHRCSGCDWCYSEGALEALDAALKAVAALPEYRMRDTCIAAIEQLREERK